MKQGIITGIILLLLALAAWGRVLAVSSRSDRYTDGLRDIRRIEIPLTCQLEEPVNVGNIIVASNPFSSSRGKAEVTPSSAAEKRKPLPQLDRQKLTLTGIFFFGKTRGALIAGIAPTSNNGKKEIRKFFQIGEDVGDNQRLAEIRDKEVVLERNGEKTILKIHPKVEKAR